MKHGMQRVHRLLIVGTIIPSLKVHIQLQYVSLIEHYSTTSMMISQNGTSLESQLDGKAIWTRGVIVLLQVSSPVLTEEIMG